MPDVIRFETPIQADAGVVDMRIRTVTIDRLLPLVKIVLQESDQFGNLVVNGKTETIRHEGVAATTLLASYESLLSAVTAQLVSGGSLPGQATVVQV